MVTDAATCAQDSRLQQRDRRATEFFSGLNVGMEETAICVVDETGKVALQATVLTDPDAIKAALEPFLSRLQRLGHEAGAVALAASGTAEAWSAGGLYGDPACARGAESAAQQDRQDGCAGACAHHAQRLVPAGAHQERELLPAAAVVDAPAQSQTQVPGSRERDPTFAQELWDSPAPRRTYEAASALPTRFKRKDKVKTWGMAIAKRTSHRKATVAVARKLADVGRWHLLLR